MNIQPNPITKPPIRAPVITPPTTEGLEFSTSWPLLIAGLVLLLLVVLLTQVPSIWQLAALFTINPAVSWAKPATGMGWTTETLFNLKVCPGILTGSWISKLIIWWPTTGLLGNKGIWTIAVLPNGKGTVGLVVAIVV